jgi:TetR/AcrR family transcriptional regulator, fatty acid metabolism regulator protein
MSDGPGKRERILKAAASVFAQYGFYNSRIAEIAKLANVANGTVYLYFRSKDEILISLFEEEMIQIIRDMKRELTSLPKAEDKLIKFIEQHLLMADEKCELAEVIQIELRQSNKFMKEYKGNAIREYLDIIAAIIKEGQEKGEFGTHIIPGVAKRILFGALDEIASYWVLTNKPKYNLDEAARMITDIFLDGIKRK